MISLSLVVLSSAPVDMLLDRDNDGDRLKAMQLLDDWLSISTELRMRPLMERVLSRRETLKA